MGGRIEAIYDYLDLKGTPRIRKIRREGKRFQIKSASWQDGKGVWHFVPGITDEQFAWWTKALYGLPELVAALRVDATVHWVEGEKDADTLAGLGLTATTTPNPSDLWDGQARWFTKYSTQSEVMVVVDNDLHGAWWGIERYSRLLRVGVAESRIHLVAPPRGYKDVTEVVEARGRLSLRSPSLARVRKAAAQYSAQRARRYVRSRSATPTPGQ